VNGVPVDPTYTEDTNADGIGAVLDPLTDFNESCTDQDVEGFDYGNAEPDIAKGMAFNGKVPDCAAGKRIRDRGSRGR
jgi:hypothetical protein